MSKNYNGLAGHISKSGESLMRAFTDSTADDVTPWLAGELDDPIVRLINKINVFIDDSLVVKPFVYHSDWGLLVKDTDSRYLYLPIVDFDNPDTYRAIIMAHFYSVLSRNVSEWKTTEFLKFDPEALTVPSYNVLVNPLNTNDWVLNQDNSGNEGQIVGTDFHFWKLWKLFSQVTETEWAQYSIHSIQPVQDPMAHSKDSEDTPSIPD